MEEQKKEKLRQKMIDLQYDFEERSAIMEFDGGMSRSEAERRAKIDLNYDGWSKLGYKHRSGTRQNLWGNND